MGFLIFCGVTLGVTILGLSIFPIIQNYHEFCSNSTVKLTFKEFKKFYSVSDGVSWSLCDNYCMKYGDNCSQAYYIKFSFPDYIKYLSFLKNKDKSKNDGDLEKFLQLIQKDIDKKRAEAEKELEQAQAEQARFLKEKLNEPSSFKKGIRDYALFKESWERIRPYFKTDDGYTFVPNTCDGPLFLFGGEVNYAVWFEKSQMAIIRMKENNDEREENRQVLAV